MALTIDDLLRALQAPEDSKLKNDYATWKRIGEKDKFAELGLKESDLDSFLKTWVEDNPYSNI